MYFKKIEKVIRVIRSCKNFNQLSEITPWCFKVIKVKNFTEDYLNRLTIDYVIREKQDKLFKEITIEELTLL